MKRKVLKGKWLMCLAFIMALTSCGLESFKERKSYSLNLADTINGSFSIMKQGQIVTEAKEGDLLFVSCVSDTGYKVDEIKVNNTVIGEPSFIMSASDTTISVVFKEIVSNIQIINSRGGTITSDKTTAKYGEEVTLTVQPDFAYYGIEKSLVVNSSTIYKSPIYKATKIKFIMPDTDVNVSMRFAKEDLNFGSTFGDFDVETRAFNSEKWDYSLDNDEVEAKKTSISLEGTGDSKTLRDAGFTYFHSQENYFYFSTAVSVSNYESIDKTFESRVGVFFGDQNQLATIGYYFKKYTANTNMYIGRKYASLSYKTGVREVTSGYQQVMGGPSGDPTSDVFKNNDVSVDSGGMKNIPNAEFKDVIMRMGFVYDGPNQKIHILFTDFSTNALVYVRTISNLDNKWFSVNEDGSVKFGLYADTAFNIKLDFFDYEFSKDKTEIETRFPEIKAKEVM